jgi:nucleotide-binding universal stress UspA family protein
MYKHILISTDGSDVAQKGVDHGLSLAKNLGARVTIITVTERVPGYVGMGAWIPAPIEMAGYEERQKEIAGKILAAAKALADRMGVEAETLHIPSAFPANAIIETAQAKHCSLIAMASHGRRGLGRLLLGSQTTEVLARSPVPVLVVR